MTATGLASFWRFDARPNLRAPPVIELATAASPNFATFSALRVIYGIAMGGVWGVASALTMETGPGRARGMVSGLFQAGYPLGYLIASIVYGLFSTVVGWRGMFAIGALPILLAIYIFFKVDESPVWLASRGIDRSTARTKIWPAIRKNWPILVFAIVLMAERPVSR